MIIDNNRLPVSTLRLETHLPYYRMAVELASLRPSSAGRTVGTTTVPLGPRVTAARSSVFRLGFVVDPTRSLISELGTDRIRAGRELRVICVQCPPDLIDGRA